MSSRVRPYAYATSKIKLRILLKLNKLEERQIQTPQGIAPLNKENSCAL